jgi:hypothetical protein
MIHKNVLYVIIMLLLISLLVINYKNINYKILIIIFIFLFLAYCIYKQIVLYENYKYDPNIIDLTNIFKNFFNNTNKTWPTNLSMLNNRNIMNEVNIYRGNKSYTINKENIYMCLKDENGNIYPTNMLIYVLAHEFAHVLSQSIGHTDEFNVIFTSLLEELEKDGIYNSNENIIQDYCEKEDNSF